MSAPQRKRGSTLVLSMLVLLIFMGVTVSMTFNAQSQANLSNGLKLQQFYDIAATSAMHRTRANLADFWNSADPVLNSNRKEWRFGSLLSAGTIDTSGGDTYGTLMPQDQWNNEIKMNAGLLDLTYKVFVVNNPDDPAFLLKGADLGDVDDQGDPELVSEEWDLDGKVIITIQVFNAADTSNPLATQSALVGLVGADFVSLHDEDVKEGDENQAGGQGRGSKGSLSRITLEYLGTIDSATP